jgi:glycosyltransferase involved in cell wall biosynthesis
MVREKGVDLLIETIKELIDAGLKIKGIFVGDGPDLPYFKTLAAKLCIGEYLTFVGSIPHKETAQFYLIADVFVLLSVYEGQGRVLLEALSCGVPVIAFKSGGIAEVVNQKVGILLEERSVKSTKEAIFALLTNNEKLKEMSINARKHIIEKYSADSTLSEIEDIYQTASGLHK